MPSIQIVIGGLMILGMGAIIYLQLTAKGGTTENPELDRLKEENGDVKARLETERSEKDKWAGENKRMYAEVTNLKADLSSLQKERDALQRRVNQFEEKEERWDKERTEEVSRLHAAQKSLDQERARVIHEDEAEQARLLSERDRIWAEHEANVIATLTELCKQPQYSFSSYTNTSLPDGFEGSLKPDFMIQFLDQYIIFDAKKSKSESLQTYINNTVKTTVAKVKKNPKIASMVYLVVPTDAIGELKNHYHPHDGYMFYIVSPESLAPILAALKRITAYEFAEQMDPQQRENIINFIAELDVHVSMRNSADVLFTKHGTELLQKAERIDPALADEVAQKKKEKVKNLPNIMNNVFKKLVASAEEQSAEVDRLIAPKAPISKKELKAAEPVIAEML